MCIFGKFLVKFSLCCACFCGIVLPFQVGGFLIWFWSSFLVGGVTDVGLLAVVVVVGFLFVGFQFCATYLPGGLLLVCALYFCCLLFWSFFIVVFVFDCS